MKKGKICAMFHEPGCEACVPQPQPEPAESEESAGDGCDDCEHHPCICRFHWRRVQGRKEERARIVAILERMEADLRLLRRPGASALGWAVERIEGGE